MVDKSYFLHQTSCREQILFLFCYHFGIGLASSKSLPKKCVVGGLVCRTHICNCDIADIIICIVIVFLCGNTRVNILIEIQSN